MHGFMVVSPTSSPFAPRGQPPGWRFSNWKQCNPREAREFPGNVLDGNQFRIEYTDLVLYVHARGADCMRTCETPICFLITLCRPKSGLREPYAPVHLFRRQRGYVRTRGGVRNVPAYPASLSVRAYCIYPKDTVLAWACPSLRVGVPVSLLWSLRGTRILITFVSTFL